MSHPLHLTANNAPAYGGANKKCLPCSGVSRRATFLSPHSWYGDGRKTSQAKTGSLNCFSRGASFVCRAGSSDQRRNHDFSKQTNGFHGKIEGRDSFKLGDESETLAPKGGPSSSSYAQKFLTGNRRNQDFTKQKPGFQPTDAPGEREKEIVELFRKVQAQLRAREPCTEQDDKKIETSQEKGKDSETVDSLLKLLRKHSADEPDKIKSHGDLISDQREDNDAFSEERSSSFFGTNTRTNNQVREPRASSSSRPASKFRKKSPVPQVKYRSIYSTEVSLSSLSELNRNEESGMSFVGSEAVLEKELVSENEAELVSKSGMSFVGSEAVLENELDSENEAELVPEAIYDDKQDEIVHEDLSALKLPDLKALAKTRGLKGFSKMKKSDLLELLTSGQEN